MGKRAKMAAVLLAIILVLAGLGTLPCQATVPGDIAAGLPLEKVIANGLGAGLAIDTIIVQALDSGAELCPLTKAALTQGVNLSRLFSLLRDYCRDTVAKYHKEDPRCEACTSCSMMKCAKEAGRDPVEIANAMMAAGEGLELVKACLAGMGVPNAETYAYSPPAPPGIPAGAGPTFPGSGGGGGVASPSS